MFRLVGVSLFIVIASPAVSAQSLQQPPIASDNLKRGPAASSPELVAPPFHCTPRVKQGGAVLCRTAPGDSVALAGAPVAQADQNGLAVIAVPRTQEGPLELSVGRTIPFPYDRNLSRAVVEIDPREDSVSRFTMQCGKIAPQDPAAERHASEAWLKKQEALKTFAPPVAPIGFAKPAAGRYSSPYGAVRTYVPDGDCEGRTSVHNGLDIAVPTGTPVVAPMGGTVILADPDLFYEGGCVFLDHGRGLVSVLMHMSRIDVKAGDVIEQGQQLGLSGATGRVTGAHLHWAIKYRNEFSDDRGTDEWLDPSLLLALSEDMLPH